MPEIGTVSMGVVPSNRMTHTIVQTAAVATALPGDTPIGWVPATLRGNGSANDRITASGAHYQRDDLLWFAGTTGGIGFSTNDGNGTVVEFFNMTNREWGALPRIPKVDFGFPLPPLAERYNRVDVGVLFDNAGRCYVLGGAAFSDLAHPGVTDVHRYEETNEHIAGEVTSNEWTVLADMPGPHKHFARYHHDPVDDQLYVIDFTGGTSSHKYNVSSGTWSVITTPPFAVSFSRFVSSTRRIYIFSATGQVAWLDVATDTWTSGTSAPASHWIPSTAATFGGGDAYQRYPLMDSQERIYLLTGKTTPGAGAFDLFGAIRYNTVSDTWTILPDMPRRSTMGYAVIHDGDIWYTGGREPNLTTVYWDTSLRFDIGGNEWIDTGEPIDGYSASTGRQAHLAGSSEDDTLWMAGSNTGLPAGKDAEYLEFGAGPRGQAVVAGSTVRIHPRQGR